MFRTHARSEAAPASRRSPCSSVFEPLKSTTPDSCIRRNDGQHRDAFGLSLGKRCALALLAMALASPALAADYVQAPGSRLSFAGTYQGEVFTGSFPAFAARLSFDPKQLASAKLDVTIQMAGATTANPDYDGEMRGASFLNTAKFAQARFVAAKFRALGGNQYAADGSLTLHGVSKPVTLSFTWTPGAKPVLMGKATVKRLDFGVGTGDWADTSLIPNAIAVSTKVVFKPAP